MHKPVLFRNSVHKAVRMVRRMYAENTEWRTLPGRSEIASSSRTSHPHVTVGTLLNDGTNVLRKQDIPEPMESVKLFIAHVLGKPTLCGVPLTQTLTLRAATQVETMIRTRLRRVPIQYIIEEWDFCDLTLKMKPPVFIPRPETEDLVGFIKTHIDQSTTRCKRILEIGCGSGAITLALLKEFQQMTAVAIDKTLAACDLTAENASRLGLTHRVDVVHRDVCHGLSDLGTFDLVVSNPPYIRSVEMDSLDAQITLYEDNTALHGGHDGLDVVMEILSKTPAVLTEKGTVWLEVDRTHPEMIRHLAQRREFPRLTYLRTLSDFTNRDRFCVLQLTETVL